MMQTDVMAGDDLQLALDLSRVRRQRHPGVVNFIEDPTCMGKQTTAGISQTNLAEGWWQIQIATGNFILTGLA